MHNKQKGVFHYLYNRPWGTSTWQSDDKSRIYKSLYNATEQYKSWNANASPINNGSIFNLEYTPSGNLLLAGCERRAILAFDPLTGECVNNIPKAHDDAVNCMKFIDSNLFVSCSDDSTIALWDLRNLKLKLLNLRGHTNWVKNVEYATKEKLLITGAFDGNIFTWDLNQSVTNSSNDIHKTGRLFHMPGLMRFRLTPDQKKMIISTTCGYLIMIHNLDLSTLANDLLGFRPNLYRIMQAGPQLFSNVSNFDHLFSKEQRINRIEFITDFPEANDPEIISALQIHPDGWCALSRNVNHNEASEWTCLHDIQDIYENDDDDNDVAMINDTINYYGNEIDPSVFSSSTSRSNNNSNSSNRRQRRRRRMRKNRNVNSVVMPVNANSNAGTNVDANAQQRITMDRARVARQARIIRQIRRIYPREDSNRIGNLVHIVSSGMVEPVRVIRARIQNPNDARNNDGNVNNNRINRNSGNSSNSSSSSSSNSTSTNNGGRGESAPGQGARSTGEFSPPGTTTDQPPDLWSAELTVRQRVNRNSYPNQPFSQINLYTFRSGIVAPNDDELRKLRKARQRLLMAKRRYRTAMRNGSIERTTAILSNINETDSNDDNDDDDNDDDDDDDDDDEDNDIDITNDNNEDDDDDDVDNESDESDESDYSGSDDDEVVITNNIRNIYNTNQRAERDNGRSSNSTSSNNNNTTTNQSASTTTTTTTTTTNATQHFNTLFDNIDDVYDNDALFHPRRSANRRQPTNQQQQPIPWIKRTRPRPMPRMISYIQESSKAKHFIKEMCFSADGRIIASPYGSGVRLLAYTNDCVQLQSALGERNGQRPFPLSEIKFLPAHGSTVVCAKFSPKALLLASGCLGGRIAWYHPVF